MSTRVLRIAATALILMALVLLVAGLEHGNPMVWGLGLAAVALAMLMSLATRWAGGGEE
jgi:hypothetical protein